MANNVHFHVTFDIDEKESKLLQFLMENISSKTTHGWLEYEIEKLPIYPTEYDEEGWYNWGIENIGAKWCHVEEYHEDYFSGYSAWSPPIPFVKHLVQYIHNELGTKPTATMTYEDEFRNFMGKQYYGVEYDSEASMAGEVSNLYNAYEEDCIETDGTELMEQFDELYPSLNSSDNDFEWHEEHEVDGETIYPYEVMDELADQFWERA